MTLVFMSDLFKEKYKNGEEHARKVAEQVFATGDPFALIIPASFLDLVPDKYFVTSIGRPYADQGVDEEAFIVSSGEGEN